MRDYIYLFMLVSIPYGSAAPSPLDKLTLTLNIPDSIKGVVSDDSQYELGIDFDQKQPQQSHPDAQEPGPLPQQQQENIQEPEPNVKGEAEVQEEAEVQGEREVQGETEVQRESGVRGKAEVQRETEVQREAGVRGVRGEAEEQRETEVQREAGVKGEAEVQGSGAVQGGKYVQGEQGSGELQGEGEHGSGEMQDVEGERKKQINKDDQRFQNLTDSINALIDEYNIYMQSHVEYFQLNQNHTANSTKESLDIEKLQNLTAEILEIISEDINNLQAEDVVKVPEVPVILDIVPLQENTPSPLIGDPFAPPYTDQTSPPIVDPTPSPPRQNNTFPHLIDVPGPIVVPAPPVSYGPPPANYERPPNSDM